MWETWDDPWVGKVSWRRERIPTPVFWPGEFHGQVQGVAKSQTQLSNFTGGASIIWKNDYHLELHSGTYRFNSGNVWANLNMLDKGWWVTTTALTTMAALMPGTSALYFQSEQGARTCKVGHCYWHYSFPKVASWGNMNMRLNRSNMICITLRFRPKYTPYEMCVLWIYFQFQIYLKNTLVLPRVKAGDWYLYPFHF